MTQIIPVTGNDKISGARKCHTNWNQKLRKELKSELLLNLCQIEWNWKLKTAKSKLVMKGHNQINSKTEDSKNMNYG